MKKTIRAVLLIFSLAFFLSSCATTKHFTVQIDSIGNDIYQEQKTYIAVPTDKDVSADDLRFKEYAGYIRKILAPKGYIEVNSSEDANIIVYLTYGVGDPELHTYAYSLPVYGQVGITVSPGPAPGHPGQPPRKPPFEHFSPIFGIVGTKTEYQTVTTYFRYCKIEAFDLSLYRTTNTEKQLWSTIITSRGESDDLRMVMPYMIAAAEQYIGVDTGRKVEVVIDEKDERASYLKR
jgi:predicted small secreted protein